MKSTWTFALIALVAGGCMVRRSSSKNSDVMDLNDVPATAMPNDALPAADAPVHEPIAKVAFPPSKAVMPAEATAVQQHTITTGDTPWSLAVKYYGDGKQWPKIIEANPGLTPERMPIGKKIVIP